MTAYIRPKGTGKDVYESILGREDKTKDKPKKVRPMKPGPKTKKKK